MQFLLLRPDIIMVDIIMLFFGSNDLINVCELYQITLNFHLCGPWRYTVNRKILDSMGNAKIKLCVLLTLMRYEVVYPKII